MIHITDEPFSIPGLKGLRDLGRNVLAGRAVGQDHPMNNSQGYHNVSTFYVTVTVLNLGNIERMPYFANKKRFPSEIRNHIDILRENFVLPHLVVNNPEHIIALCEPFEFTVFNDLCVEYNVIGIQRRSTGKHQSPLSNLHMEWSSS